MTTHTEETMTMRERLARHFCEMSEGKLADRYQPNDDDYEEADRILKILGDAEPVVGANGEAGTVEVNPDGSAAYQHFVAQAGPYREGTPVVVMDETEARLLTARLAAPPPDEMERLRALIRELATDVEHFVAKHYGVEPGADPDDVHPALKAKYIRDMDGVWRARRALTSQEGA